MDSDEGKLFIGGISWGTTEDKLNEYFGKYGEVLQSVVMRDKITGRPRGFGFVVFSDPSILDRVLQDQHIIDGRTVEAKRALSREEQHTTSRSGNPNGRSFGGGGNIKTKKIFVGGLPPTLSEEGFRQYFEAYGQVADVVVVYDQDTKRPRGFGFISFDTEEAVDRVLHKTFHDLNGKLVEVKRALPKELNSGGGGRSMGGGSHQGYGASGANTGTYDGQIDNRYMQPQATGGGFPAYGSANYGYGAANNTVGYGVYGVGGYGSSNAGFNGPTGSYGNSNVPNVSYASGPPGAARSPWGTQVPSTAYGVNTGYGNAAPWSTSGIGGGVAGSGGTVSAPTCQSPSGVTGYVNQGYVYGGSDGSYANPNSYGAARGRARSTPNGNTAGNGGASGGNPQGTGSGYMESGYDANSVYPNAAWKTDPSQAGNYGAAQANLPPGGQVGYGGAHSRQAQQ